MEWGLEHVWNTLLPSYNPVLGKTLKVDTESWSLVATDSNWRNLFLASAERNIRMGILGLLS